MYLEVSSRPAVQAMWIRKLGAVEKLDSLDHHPIKSRTYWKVESSLGDERAQQYENA